jgi:hypothetical protein
LPETAFNTGQLTDCPACSVLLQVEVFPALLRPIESGITGEAILVDGEASCFYHPQKRASTPCTSCGRFLCALCDVELNGRHMCPVCLDTGQKKGKLTELESKRTLFDSAALTLSLVPLIVWPFTFLTAPGTIVLAIYAWNKPSSVVPRTRVRIYLALFIALLQIAGWVVFLWVVFRR